MSGTDLLDHQALDAPGQDGNESDCDEGDEVFLRPLEDGVQPPVIGNPGEGALHHPADSSWKEFSIAAASDGIDGDAEFLPRFGQTLAPVAEVAQRGSPEPLTGEITQYRHDAFCVVDIGWLDIDRQRDAILVDAQVNFDPVDLLAAIKAALEAARR
jgi:hypothetical protein